MIQTILFDLDDTLLHNEAGEFFRTYVALLAPHLEPWMKAQDVSVLMWESSEAMMANRDPSKTLIQVFWQAVEQAGYPAQEMAAAFDRFYETDYLQLGEQMKPMPGARPLLQWAQAQGYQAAIATTPIFPDIAIRRRLEWAGVADFSYVLVTTCENMHFSKPNPLYYQEILQKIAQPPQACVMVGNDPQLDMVAGQVGIRTYLVSQDHPSPEITAQVDGYGPLPHLRPWLQSREM